MKNKYLKGAIISSSIAIATGVLFFGINATFGAPTYQPPGTDVKPTFSGINVTGTIVNPTGDVTVDDNLDAKKDVTITGKISNPTANPLEIYDGLKITNGDLDITAGSLKNTFNGTVFVKGGLDVETKLSADTLLAESVASNIDQFPFQIADDLKVTGNATLLKDLSSKNLSVTGTTNLKDLSVTGKFESTGKITGTGGFSAVGTSEVDSNGLSGLLMLGSTTYNPRMAMDRDDICSYGTPLYLNYYTPNDVVIGAPNGGSDLEVNGKVTTKNGLAVTGDATVSGKVTATGKITSTTGIGKFTRQISAYSKITAGVGNFFETSVSCDGFGVIVSCGGQGSASSPGYTPTGKVSFSNLDAFTDNKCYARGVNSGATDQYIAAIATCFDYTK